MHMKGFTALCITIAVAACGQGHAAAVDSARADSVARAIQDSTNRTQPGYIVDSILPVDEQIRRFRATITHAPAQLGGKESRAELVAAFVGALEAKDTSALVALTINRAEFAYLVYPESPFAVEPMQQAPDLVWLRHVAASGTGLTRLLERMSGRPLGYKAVDCAPTPITEGKNRIWKDCMTRYEPPGGKAESLRLFAGIIEREGRFKILSYANAF
jgi:hypothetical protein